MVVNLRSGRIVGPLHFANFVRGDVRIPNGPCLLEQLDDDRVAVIWGASGQHSQTLSRTDLEVAAASGSLLLLETSEAA
jgi:hypothetical protein